MKKHRSNETCMNCCEIRYVDKAAGLVRCERGIFGKIPDPSDESPPIHVSEARQLFLDECTEYARLSRSNYVLTPREAA